MDAPYKLQTSKLPSAVGGVGSFFWWLWWGDWYFIAAILVVALVTYAATRVSVDVGVDGVLIRKTFTKRFLSYDDIADVAHVDPVRRGWRRLVFLLHSGESVTVRTDRHSVPRSTSNAAMIEHDIAEARRRGRGGESTAVDLVSPGGLDASAWLAALRGVLANKSTYRQRVVTPPELQALVDDAAVPLRARIGAAVALESAGFEANKRLRIFADGVADPTERKHMMRIADATEDELTAELEHVLRESQERS